MFKLIQEISAELDKVHHMVAPESPSRILSPVEKMLRYSELVAEGKEQQEVADYYNVSPGYVCNILKLKDFSEGFQVLIHLGAYRKHLAHNKLEHFDLFRDGQGMPYAPTWSNVMSVLKLFPLKYAEDYKDKVDLINAMMGQLRIIESISTMSKVDFNVFINGEAKLYGIIDKEDGAALIASRLNLNRSWKNQLSGLLAEGKEELWDCVEILKKYNILT